MVQLLLQYGADPNSAAAKYGGATAIQFAAMSGNCNIVKELLCAGAKLDGLPSKVHDFWPLEAAASKGRLDMLRLLWGLGAKAQEAGLLIDVFARRQCLRAMNFARNGGYLGCRDLISELSGISVDGMDTEEYGALATGTSPQAKLNVQPKPKANPSAFVIRRGAKISNVEQTSKMYIRPQRLPPVLAYTLDASSIDNQ